MKNGNDIRPLCMFCGEAITETAVDPCALEVAVHWPDPGFDGETACYWCHADCLRTASHPSVPLYVLDLGETSESD